MTTLFEKDRHITDVGIQHDGEIAIGSGGTAGEFYLRVPCSERLKLLSALAAAAEEKLSDNMSGKVLDETLLSLFSELFGNRTEDPYDDIEAFLKANNVRFRSDYWVGER